MDGENRGERDRAVVRALRSLEPLTGPTAAERQRIRDRVLLALDAASAVVDDSPEASAPAPPESATATDTPRPVPLDGTATTRTTATSGDSPLANAPPSPGSTQHVRTGDSPAPASPRSPRQARAERPATPRPTTARGQAHPRGRDDDRQSPLTGVRGRFAVAALAVLALVGSLAGMSVLLARDALPGDALYGVKRTAEAASLGLTFGDEPRALKHLEFAAARISEIETLARRYPTPEDAPVGSYLTALTDFDNDAAAGSRQLVHLATRGDGRLLESLRDWSTQQAVRLERVADRLPEAARNRQTASRALLDRVTARADALLARMDCYQITSGSSDDVGALPATAACEEAAPTPAPSTPPASVPGTTDSSVPPTGPEAPSSPLPPAAQTPAIPPVPVPGATASVPLPTRPTVPSTQVPETPPSLELPPLLPGLPTLSPG